MCHLKFPDEVEAQHTLEPVGASLMSVTATAMCDAARAGCRRTPGIAASMKIERDAHIVCSVRQAAVGRWLRLARISSPRRAYLAPPFRGARSSCWPPAAWRRRGCQAGSLSGCLVSGLLRRCTQRRCRWHAGPATPVPGRTASWSADRHAMPLPGRPAAALRRPGRQ